MNPLVSGFALIFLAAVAGGAFAVPLRTQVRYAWENTWLLAFFVALIVIPTIVVSIFLPVWSAALVAAGPRAVLLAMAFGFLWGWGAVTFAIGISRIGLSVGYATIMGLSTAIGSIIPMIRRWEEVPANARTVIALGIGVCIAGVAVCGRAGAMREKAAASTAKTPGGADAAEGTAVKVFLVGIAWCVLSGFLSACANLGFDFADRIAQEAVHLGAGPLAASVGRWIAVYWGGFLAISLGSGGTMLKKGTWRNYAKGGLGRDFALAVTAGCCHFLAQIPYGMGAYYLGRLGTTVGWVINISASLLVANAFAFLTKEWKGAPRGAVTTLLVGLGTLVAAMVIIAYGNGLLTSASAR